MSSLIACIIVIAAVMACLYVVVTNVNSQEADKAFISATAIQLKELNTEEKKVINFAEKPTIVVFFTSWCPYCNEDAPKVVSLYDKYKDRLNVYGINLIKRDDSAEVRNYVNQHGITYPVLLDETQEVYDYFGGQGFPAMYFVNSRGELIDEIIGSTDLETMEESIHSLMDNYN